MILETIVSLLVVWLTWSVVSYYMVRRKTPPGPFPIPFVGMLLPQMLCDPPRLLEFTDDYDTS
jgi:hypothetical protein